VARDADDKTIVDDLPRAEIDAGLINTLDGNDVTQKEYGLLIEVHDRASLLQWLRVRWLISSVRPGERSIAGQRDYLPLVLGACGGLLRQKAVVPARAQRAAMWSLNKQRL
jgi:hypothetical protein